MAQSVEDGGAIFISKTNKNNYAKNTGATRVEPASMGLESVKEKPLFAKHQFGKQTTSDRRPLDPSNSFTEVYRKRQSFDGKEFKLEPLPD